MCQILSSPSFAGVKPLEAQSSTKEASSKSYGKILAKLDQHIQRQVKEKKVVGCAVAVVDHGKVIFMKAYGVRKKGKKAPIDLDTTFQLGSISKPISATLVALLKKEKHLDLHMPVHSVHPNISPHTHLRHVLSHTTGYERTGWNSKIEAHQSRELLLEDLLSSSQTQPGEIFDYHNLAYTLIEEIITSLLKQPFQHLLKVKLFHPLGMKKTSIGDLDFRQESNYAWPHEKTKKSLGHPCKTYSRAYHRSVSSAAGVNASIREIVRFLQLQLGEMPHLLTSQDLLPFQTPVIEAPDAARRLKDMITGNVKSYYGLGWRIIDTDTKRIIFHGGYLKGFTNFLGFIPQDQIGIVILNNGESKFSIKTALKFFYMVSSSSGSPGEE